MKDHGVLVYADGMVTFIVLSSNFKVLTHLIVQLCKPISNPELEVTACLSKAVHVDGLHYALSNVHAAYSIIDVFYKSKHGV